MIVLVLLFCLQEVRINVTSFYLQDGQQNVRALSDTTSNVTDSYLYDAYGNLQNRTGTTVNPYQYTGQQLDSLTGLYNLRARNYDPSVGRFLSQDSAALNTQNPLELNRYVYTADNPVNGFDPSGHLLIEFSFSVQKAVAVGIAAGGILSIWYVIYHALSYFYSLPQPLPDWPNWTPRVIPGGNPNPNDPNEPPAPYSPNDPGLPNNRNQPNPPPNDGSNPGDKPNLDPYRLPYPLPPNEPSTPTPTPLKGIALGLSDNAPTLPRTYYLSKFFSSLNSKLRPQGIRVYLASEWYRSGLSTVPAQDPNFPKALNDAETRAWHIYFNLEGFAGDPVQLAEKSEGKFRPREYTDSELYTIRHNPDFCAKTTFYTSGSNSSNMGEDVSGTIKQSICGL